MGTASEKVDAPAPDAPERAGDPSSAGVEVAAVLVGDGVAAGPGQLTRAAFVERLDAAVRGAVDEVLAPDGRTTRDCPYLERYLERLRAEPVERLASAMRLWVNPVRDTPDDWLGAVSARARTAAVAWRDGRPDALVEEVTPTGAADFHESSRRAHPRAVMASLGAGESLSSGLRSRAERAFGVDLSHVRIHLDEAAQRIAGENRARAFTVGEHVGFAAGEFRPGTPVGDAVLAHEVAHTLQQSGSTGVGQASAALEREAGEAALRSGQSLQGAGPRTAAPRGGRGLSLQRCGTSEGPAELPQAPSMLSAEEGGAQEGGAQDQAIGDEVAGTPQVPSGQAPQVQDQDPAAVTEDLSDWTWAPETDADVAVVLVGQVAGSTESHVFVVPGAGVVSNGAPPAPARTGAPPAQRPVLARLPASGHAGVHLIHTGHGLGAMVDVGGQRTGGASVVQVQSIQAVAARFGITSVSNVLVSHTHADHVSNLTSLVQANVVRAANVHVAPGSQGSTLGPLGSVLTELRQPQHTAAGFGPAWSPSALTMQEVPGAGGASTMQSRLVLRGAVIEAVADTRSLNAYNQALRAGDWRRASRLADAASLMTRVAGTQGGPGMLITGDMRGRDILRIQQSMGEPAFRAFVQQTSTLSGLHHLGAVGNAADVRGLQALLRAMSSSGREVTVVAQTGGRNEINMNLVRALQQSGVRVVAAREAQGRADQQISVGGSGSVRGQGASEWAADPAATAARARVRTLERAATALETTSTYRTEGGTGGRSQAISGLRAEAERLRGALDARMQLATNQLTSQTRQSGPALSRSLEANTAALGQTSEAERSLTPTEVQRLARSAEAAGRLDTALRRAERGGYARHEVRRLIFEVDPATARRILGETVGQAGSRHLQRTAWREAARALRRQAALNRIASSSGGGARARGPALFGLAMEAWNLAGPFIRDAIDESQARDRRDFYLFWRDIAWWQEKGLRPSYRAYRGGELVAGDAIAPGVQHRVWSDLSERDRERMPLSDEASRATSVEQLLIPPVHEWEDEQQRLFWTDLLLWTSEHVNDFQDYAAEFLDNPWSPIRQTPGTEGRFGEQTWQIRVGTRDGDGHVLENWQSSPDLTRIMNATARRVIAGTNREIRERWTDPGTPDTGPAIQAAGTPLPRRADMRPTRIRRFAAGADRHVYEEFRGEVRRLDTFRFYRDATPVFLVHGRQEAPRGYVWVSGADYNTFSAIRTQQTTQLRAEVRIPKEPPPAYGEALYSGRPQDYMNESELAAWQAIGSSPNVVYERQTRPGQFRGTVYLYERAPNYTGLLLVRVDSLAGTDTPSSELAWGGE